MISCLSLEGRGCILEDGGLFWREEAYVGGRGGMLEGGVFDARRSLYVLSCIVGSLGQRQQGGFLPSVAIHSL